jgi:hypothetical protein
MMRSLQETLVKIREAGLENTRVMPVPGTKKSSVQVKKSSGWVTVLTTDSAIAEDVLRQARSNVICG